MTDPRAQLQAALAGQYTIERELGGGGMSRTYVAREHALDRLVVVKVLAPELLQGLSVERFRREVLLAAQLQHPHVVPVLSAGDANGLPWFTMPYVDGDSLRQRLAQGPVGITETVGILRDVARALAYAHRHGVVHRDIKPDNVLLSAGSATVTDFGIAKAINAARTGADAATPALTMTGMSIGTPTYMSPEQAAGDPNMDARADLYSFGVMAYELLAGRPPFHGLAPAKLLAAHLGERPRPIKELRPDCPDALAAVVMQCLEKEPGQRPQEAADVARVLDTITSSGAAVAAPSILSGGRIRLGRAIGLWAAATLGVSITAWAAREVIGLPEWTFPGAIGVMLAGLPVILATWYVQRTVHRTYTATPQQTPGGTTSVKPVGTMATLAIKASPHLSWRRTWLGGGLAVGGFAVMIAGWMVMRAAGIGPFGSLQGTGAFGSRETIVVADFQSPPDDPTLGPTVAEALRTDLVQSRALNVLTRAETREALTRMRRGEDETVPFAVARELATREGAKAVLDGSIVQLGRSYVVTARLVSALDGQELVPFRETAENQDELLPALGRIARAVRERSGESLRSIRQSDELSRVTTASLPALRRYVEGVRVADELGDVDRGLELLQDAVELDTAFAMAWRKIAALLNNDGRDPARATAALVAAYRHRDRLTELERYLTEGYYYTRGPVVDWRRALESYEAASRVPGAGTAGLNNRAVILGYLREHEEAEALYRQVVNGGSRFAGAWRNLMIEQYRIGASVETLDSSLAGLRAAFPGNAELWASDMIVARARDDWSAMDSIGRTVFASDAPASQRQGAARAVFLVSTMRGQPARGLEWRQRHGEILQRSDPNFPAAFAAAVDSAVIQMTVYERPEAARAALARGVRRDNLDALPAGNPQWVGVLVAAAVTRSPDLARQARRALAGQLAQFGPDTVGVRARFDALEQLATGNPARAATLMAEADRRLMTTAVEAAAIRATAFEETGAADSAIIALETVVQDREAYPEPHAFLVPNAHRRLGELYEARGDTANAIRHYERFVELWENAEPELQPRVREARERLQRLRPRG